MDNVEGASARPASITVSSPSLNAKHKGSNLVRMILRVVPVAIIAGLWMWNVAHNNSAARQRGAPESTRDIIFDRAADFACKPSGCSRSDWLTRSEWFAKRRRLERLNPAIAVTKMLPAPNTDLTVTLAGDCPNGKCDVLLTFETGRGWSAESADFCGCDG